MVLSYTNRGFPPPTTLIAEEDATKPAAAFDEWALHANECRRQTGGQTGPAPRWAFNSCSFMVSDAAHLCCPRPTGMYTPTPQGGPARRL